LNGISIWVLTVAKAKSFPLPDFAELRASRYQRRAQCGNVFGEKHNLWAFFTRRWRAGVKGDSRAARVKLLPTFLLCDLVKAKNLAVEFAHRIHLSRK
jgi:hypothetical protein